MSEFHTSASSNLERGLSAIEAANRFAREGANELPGSRPRSFIAVTRGVLAEPMFLLLLAAAGIYVVLGDLREALVLAASIVIVIAITIVQERRTDHALARLRDLASPRALVVRDGIERRIDSREIVVGDLLVLQEGDRVPADANVRSATALSVDESILTGESLPVDKEAETTDAQGTSVYSGSLIVRGFGTAEVFATGARTQMGRIGRDLSTLQPETTPLFREVRRVVRWVAAGGLLLCTAIAVIYGYTRTDWLGGILAGITVAMGVLPEEFPVVLTVFLAMGAWRISRNRVLTRRMPAVESIGAATILAVDKTGTLTENRMRVAVLEARDGSRAGLRGADALAETACRSVLSTALAASERNAFDPMERAIHDAAGGLLPDEVRDLHSMHLVREYDLTPALLAVTHVWRREQANVLDVTVKGAPETVFDLCKLGEKEKAILAARTAAYARDGLRVLGVARGQYAASTPLPDSPHEFDLELLGLLCLADPLREDVPAALAECAEAGIRVVMITGDHPGTALAIAAQAGFDISAGALAGADLESMSDENLRERARSVNVYARAKPEHKLRLVRSFKEDGEIVAMTGDGVNDAPALKAAHVGVAMGRRGTDVAREAASLVLLNDDFVSLVQAVRLGRRIYDNILHAMGFIVAVHIPIAGMGLLPVLLGWPLLLFPVHVLFLEFVIDPACTFVFESEKEANDIMRRKPRPRDARLFSRRSLIRSVALGCVVLLFAALVYGVALTILPTTEARALAFTAMVLSNLLLIFGSRAPSESFARILAKPNPVFWWIAVIALTALAVSLYVPGPADVFQFSTPSLPGLGIVLGAALVLLVTLRGVTREEDVTRDP